MLKNGLKNRLKLSIFGVNLKRLIKNLYKNNIDIYDLNQVSFKQLDIIIKAKDLKKIKPLLKDYKFEITSSFGLSKLKNFALCRIGLFAVVIMFFIALFLNSNFLGKIYIFGINQIDSKEITQFLEKKGIKQNKFFVNIDLEKLEIELESNFPEISLCSVVKKGTNLLVNIKEKIEVTELENESNIYAKESGKILELSVVNGTTDLKVGDSVKKGDVLIWGYTLQNGEKVSCKANGHIKMQVWYSKSVTFLETEKVTKKTGKMLEHSYFEIFGRKFKIKTPQNNFKNFEKVVKTEYLFKNLLLPIKIYKETYFEIEENLIKNDFSLQKDAIIDTIIKETKALVPSGKEIENCQVEISDTENGKIISCFVETIEVY